MLIRFPLILLGLHSDLSGCYLDVHFRLASGSPRIMGRVLLIWGGVPGGRPS